MQNYRNGEQIRGCQGTETEEGEGEVGVAIKRQNEGSLWQGNASVS